MSEVNKENPFNGGVCKACIACILIFIVILATIVGVLWITEIETTEVVLLTVAVWSTVVFSLVIWVILRLNGPKIKDKRNKSDKSDKSDCKNKITTTTTSEENK